jgi:hypothetical protein
MPALNVAAESANNHIEGLARRTNTEATEGTPIPVTSNPPARPGDRHKPRRMVGLTPEQYDLLVQLAKEHERPVLWEIRIGLNNHLRAHGKLPPEKKGKGAT